MDFAVVIPVLNQLRYTVQCLESLARDGISGREVVVVDNGSTDGTAEFLKRQPELRVVSNPTNLGCSAAWNQGVEVARAEWTLVLNNDVVVAPGFRAGLLAFAAEARCDIVSPAMGEGELDYELGAFAQEFAAKMGRLRRDGLAHGVGFLVHRPVFEKIGLFDTRLGQAGYEDEDFFRRARTAGFRLGTTGRAYLHHFGSVTQKSLKAERGTGGPLGNREYFRKKHGLNWLRRRLDRLAGKLRWARWRRAEGRQAGWALIMRRVGGQWQPC